MVFGLFSKERSLQRAMDKASNKLAQSPDRYAAMEKLRNAETPEALYALLKRFSFNYDKTIEDEQEKQWVYESMCAKRELALAPLRQYLEDSDSIAYPLRILENIASADQALQIIDDLLAGEDTDYTRDPGKRIQIIDWLADYTDCDDQEIVRRVAPYVDDFDENVRFSAIGAIGLHACDEGADPLLDRLLDDDEESKRLKLQIAEILAEHAMDVGSRKHEISALLDDLLIDYKIQHEKLVKK